MASSVVLAPARPRKLVALVVVAWLAVIIVLAGVLASSQSSARRGIEQRLVARTAAGAEFASLYVKDIFARERVQAGILLSARETTPRAMERASSSVGVSAAVLLDNEGRVLQVLPAEPALISQDIAPKYAHLASAVAGRAAVSNVVPSAARGRPVVGFAEPFTTSSGRRVFSGAYDVSQTPLGAYLNHLIVLPGNRVYLVDATGALIASNGPQRAGAKTLAQIDGRLATLVRTRSTGSYASGNDRQSFVSVPVDGTPWRIVAAVPESQLYTSISGASKWLAWLGLISLAIAGLAIILLGFRLLRSRARLTALNAELDRVGRVDSLSGLRNRRDIEETLVAAHRSAGRRQTTLAVLLIDIDQFKRINDTLGHEAGDAVIVSTGETIRTSVRGQDAVGRWGGEEFLAVLPDTDTEGALLIAERLRARVAGPAAATADSPTAVTVTVGVAVWTSGAMDDLITRADRALYAGKAAGRNNVQIFAEPLTPIPV